MNIKYLGWREKGNEDNVVIIVDLPDHEPLNSDSFFDSKSLVIYGRRNGKLRSKLISYYDASHVMIDYRNRGYSGPYGLDQKKLKHLRSEIDKHLSWAMLSI